ncbi:DMT family transporter [Flavobacterium ardleyense]|uniref:DMT family transporter n=1 Tax=Flavobacterium ardleyense TaxID=2038737 RepID=A0ABW5Z560_9FLAO
MQNDNLKSYFHLHIIVFIWGFTAVLGKLVSLEALDLVWYRMFFAAVIMVAVILITRERIKVPLHILAGFIISGIIIALHWLTFYQAIKVSNVSITLACLSTGAFFASILEPIFYKRKVIWYEVLFGLIVIFGLGIIFKVETQYTAGIYLAVTSAFLSALFSVINGKYAKEYNPNVISIYELSSGVIFISIYLFFAGNFTPAFFALSLNDLLWLLILSSVCTAYAFSASIKVMKFLSPFTVMLTINLEPIYGIFLVLLIFPENEKMSPMFYLGALIILATVIANGIMKSRKKRVTMLR